MENKVLSMFYDNIEQNISLRSKLESTVLLLAYQQHVLSLLAEVPASARDRQFLLAEVRNFDVLEDCGLRDRLQSSPQEPCPRHLLVRMCA